MSQSLHCTRRTLTSPEDFEALMNEVDDRMAANDVGIPSRPFLALPLVSRALGTDLDYPPPERGPAPGVYSGPDLVLHMERWFRKRYGSKLEEYWGPGCIAILLRGDIWTIRYPFILAAETGADLIFHTGSAADVASVKEKQAEHRAINICEAVEGLPVALAAALTAPEQQLLLEDFMRGWKALMELGNRSAERLMRSSAASVAEAVFNMTPETPNWGQSKWGSQLVVEKALKAYLERKGVGFDRIHDLQKLGVAANAAGLPSLSPNQLAAVQCTAGVRYGEIPVSRAEALAAHRASLELIQVIAPAP